MLNVIILIQKLLQLTNCTELWICNQENGAMVYYQKFSDKLMKSQQEKMI